ncbi:DUF3221 domain-containing protein [Gracilibacillus lacisalsi]|uniref:DUF3221 domain-containing protein n=1 Tax=Gracilibacillus lacisalsi TaxID=393087 RepID=UPI00036D5876|nr:DUF3221 domain-containing protein [Gracilibacillus lacisalsi]
MKNVLGIITLLFVTACGTNLDNGNKIQDDVQNVMEGYVANIGDNSVLVVENRLDPSISEFHPEQHEEAGNAISFSLDDIEDSMADSLMRGEKIQVTHGAVAESYPGQSSAIAIKRIVDEEHDMVIAPDETVNLVALEQFIQKTENNEEATMRGVNITVEGSSVFDTYIFQNGEYTVKADATQDNFVEVETISEVSCPQLEYYLTDDQHIMFELTGCDNNTGVLTIANLPFKDMIVPEDIYHRVEVIVGEEVVLDTTDESEKEEIITNIREGTPQSVMTMTMMAPEGEIILYGKQAIIHIDYQEVGNVIRYNTLVEAGLTFD